MRKLVVQLAIVALVSGATAVLPGCGSSSPTDQPVAASTESTPPHLKPTATESAPPVDDSVSTPTPTSSAGDGVESPPVAAPTETLSPLPRITATESAPLAGDSVSTPTPPSSTDDGIEVVSADSSGTSGKQEPITGVDTDSPRKGSPGATGPVEGESYAWQDGDRTMTVKLQTDLVVEKGSGGLPRSAVSADEGGNNVVRSADGQSKSDTLPVFRSESGCADDPPRRRSAGAQLRMEPGGNERFFLRATGSRLDRVSELDYAVNGFFVETEPGFPSLDLANALAAQDGVEISSPNWGREAIPK